MNTLVPVRMLRPWRRLKAGHVFTPTGMVRSFLVRNRFAEIVRDDPAPTIEYADLKPVHAETATARRQRKSK